MVRMKSISVMAFLAIAFIIATSATYAQNAKPAAIPQKNKPVQSTNKVQTALNAKLDVTTFKNVQEFRNQVEKLGLYNIGGGGLLNDSGNPNGFSIEIFSAIKNNDHTKYSRFFLVKELENDAVEVVDELAFDRNAPGYIGFISLVDANGNTVSKFARYISKGDRDVDVKYFYEVENDKFVSKKQPFGKWRLDMD